MQIVYFFSAVMISVAIFILLKLTPHQISKDVMAIISPPRTLKYKIDAAQGKVKSGRIQKFFDNMAHALTATKSENKFSILITICVLGICAGVLIGGLTANLLLALIAAAVGVAIPYIYVTVMVANYKKHISEELETALSIITTNYISNGDIIYAVEQSIEHINPPVQQAFKKFLGQTKLISSNVVMALEQLKDEIDNEIFHEWVDNLIECQENSTLKMTLQPIAARLSDIRIVNAELQNALMQPRKEVFTMLGLVLANYPLIFFLNADWFSVLTSTIQGLIVNCIVAITTVIVVVRTYKLTQPIEFKR